VGIDPAEAQLAFARARISDGRTKFQAGDALDIPFDDNAFDVAASALVLNFVADQNRMVAEMRRVVRPAGKVAAYVWDFAGGGEVAHHIGLTLAARDPEEAKRAAAGLQAETTRLDTLAEVFSEAEIDRVSTQAI
jgi:SAM-dependent methyltransferase